MLRCRLFGGSGRLWQLSKGAASMGRGEADQDAVRLIQQCLVRLDVASLRRSRVGDGFDGSYGGETQRAVLLFQQNSGVFGPVGQPDGVVDQVTLLAMDRDMVIAERAPTPPMLRPGVPASETPATVASGTPRLPSAARVDAEYRNFRAIQGRPCVRTGDLAIRNQCAVRLSVALYRSGCGFHLGGVSEAVRPFVHSNETDSEGAPVPAHITNARALMNYIVGFWPAETFRVTNAADAARANTSLRGRKGIVHFERTRLHTDSAETGHIDYWNGQRPMNDELNYNAPNERPSEAPTARVDRWIAGLPDRMRFIPLPD